MVNPHRAAVAMIATMLALPLSLEYIVMLGDGGGGSIRKSHPSIDGDAATDARCVLRISCSQFAFSQIRVITMNANENIPKDNYGFLGLLILQNYSMISVFPLNFISY